MYSRSLNGRILTFGASGWTYLSTFVLHDWETNSLWFGGVSDIGRQNLKCVAGELQGAELELYPHERMLWTSWTTWWPETKFMLRK